MLSVRLGRSDTAATGLLGTVLAQSSWPSCGLLKNRTVDPATTI